MYSIYLIISANILVNIQSMAVYVDLFYFISNEYMSTFVCMYWIYHDLNGIRIQNSEVKNVSDAIKIQKAHTKLSVEQHGPYQEPRRNKHPLLICHTCRAPLVEIRDMGLPVVKANIEPTVLTKINVSF
jgi:hypothetical protein